MSLLIFKKRSVYYGLFYFLLLNFNLFVSCIGGSSSGADNPELTLTVNSPSISTAKYSIYTSDFNPVFSNTSLFSGSLDSLNQISITSNIFNKVLEKIGTQNSSNSLIHFNVLVESDSLIGFLQNLTYDDINKRFLLNDSILGNYGPDIVLESSKPFRSTISDSGVFDNSNNLPYIYIPGTPWKAIIENNGSFVFSNLPPSVPFKGRLINGSGEIYNLDDSLSFNDSMSSKPYSIDSIPLDTVFYPNFYPPTLTIQAYSDTTLLFYPGLNLSFYATISPDTLWDITSYYVSWKALPGSEHAVITQPYSWGTSISFNLPGKYAFEVSSSVARQLIVDTLYIFLFSDSSKEINTNALNLPPKVFAGPDTVLYIGDSTWFLRGIVKDDGLPFEGILSTRWALIDSSLPLGFFILNKENRLSEVIITKTGTYAVQFSAYDGELGSLDTIMIEVRPKITK